MVGMLYRGGCRSYGRVLPRRDRSSDTPAAILWTGMVMAFPDLPATFQIPGAAVDLAFRALVSVQNQAYMLRGE